MGIKLKSINNLYADIAARNAIVAGDRKIGMTVTVLDNGSAAVENFRLEGGIANSNWATILSIGVGAGSITLAMMADLAADTIVGRANGAGTGVPTALTAAQIRTIINVENGADVTDATNVNAAGATMNSDTDVKANDWIIDEDTMVSNDDTKVATQQSVKAYVDATVSSSKAYQGGYDASTDTPSLDDGTPIAGILSGFQYDVTVAGNFFAIAVEIGDVLTAKQDSPTTTGHWIVSQTNSTAASTKILYEANADTNEFSDTEKTKLTNIEALADVTDATNVNAAGATMNTDTTLAGNGYFLDEDTLSSDSATKVASQQSIKAYIDAQLLSGSIVNDGNTASFTKIKTKVFQIVNWDMDANETFNVAHGITDEQQIRTCQATIRPDSGGTDILYDLSTFATGTHGYILVDGLNIRLLRITGNFFDAATFDEVAGYVRGWLTVTYEDT